MNAHEAAARLVCGVADHNPAETHKVLLKASHDDLMRIAVLLAASVDPKRPLYAASDETTESACVARIVSIVTARMGVTPIEVYSRKRDVAVAEARQVVCWVASAEGMTSVAIGRTLRRDHSTVLHSIDRVTRTPKLLTTARAVVDEIRDHEREAA